MPQSLFAIDMTTPHRGTRAARVTAFKSQRIVFRFRLFYNLSSLQLIFYPGPFVQFSPIRILSRTPHHPSKSQNTPTRLISLDLHPPSRRNTSRALLLPLDFLPKLELQSLDLVSPERQRNQLITVVSSGEGKCLHLVFKNIDDGRFQDGEFRAGEGALRQ